jgi:hypothetical protein
MLPPGQKEVKAVPPMSPLGQRYSGGMDSALLMKSARSMSTLLEQVEEQYRAAKVLLAFPDGSRDDFRLMA